MNMARHILALIAALTMTTPGVCMCGCPCDKLMAGDSKPVAPAAKPGPSCCHCAAPDASHSLVAPHDCCCASKDRPVAEVLSSSPEVPLDGTFVVAVATAPSLHAVAVDARSGHDPPRVSPVSSPPSLLAVLRN